MEKFSKILESLFATDDNAAVAQIETEVILQFLKKYMNIPESKANTRVIRIKKLAKTPTINLVLDGSLIGSVGPKVTISKFEESEWPTGLRFSKVKDITVCIKDCPNIKDLGNLFTGVDFVNASLEIINCPKLNSLAGAPASIDGSFVCINLPSLKDIKGMPSKIEGTISMRKLGTRIKKSVIKSYITNTPMNILAESEEDVVEKDENEINEAFADGRLSMIWNFVKSKTDVYNKFSDFIYRFTNLYSYSYIEWDNVSSEIIEMRLNSLSKDQEKLLNSMFSTRADTSNGLIVGLKGNKIMIIIGTPHKGSVGGRRAGRTDGFPYINIQGKINYSAWKYGVDLTKFSDVRKEYLSDCDLLWVWPINLNDYDTDNVRKKRKNRADSRAGMINPGDAEQYKKIAQENIKRYKDILAKQKFTKISDISAESDQVQKLLNRYLKLTMDVATGKTNMSKYDLDSIQKLLTGRYRSEWNKRNFSTTVLERDGVIELLSKCATIASDLKVTDPTTQNVGSLHYNSAQDLKEKFTNTLAELRQTIQKADVALKTHGY